MANVTLDRLKELSIMKEIQYHTVRLVLIQHEQIRIYER